MYGVDLSVQLENLMPFLGLGFFLGFFYDIISVFRYAFCRFKTLIFVFDFLFCILTAVISYLLFLGTTNGVIRIYLVLAEITGAAVYFFTVGRIISRMVRRIAKAFSQLFRFLFAPFMFLKKKSQILIKKTKAFLLKNMKIIQNKLKKHLKDAA